MGEYGGQLRQQGDETEQEGERVRFDVTLFCLTTTCNKIYSFAVKHTQYSTADGSTHGVYVEVELFIGFILNRLLAR